MGHNERKTYLKKIRSRYRNANKATKVKILDEFCAVCDYHRKHAIRVLNGPLKRQNKKPPGRLAIYDSPEVITPLKAIWLATDQMCSKKLKSAMPLWLPHYESEYGMLDATIRSKLLSISAPTIDRKLKPMRAKHKRHGLCGTKPGSLLKNHIPIKTDNWDVSKPGFVEADTVAHCGNSLSGEFVWSLTLTDIYSGWTEIRALWGKGSTGVIDKVSHIESKLSFPLLGFDCDNGSEFLNYHLLRYFTERPQKVQFTRSRPYHKNDNAHVEQKNWTHVRQLFGYDRIDQSQLVGPMNDLYANEWSLLQNFFHPSVKLTSKERVNSKYKKKYDKPQTPYQRLMASGHITKEKKEQLTQLFNSLNPFSIKKEIEQKLTCIFKDISVTSNVRQRL